MKFTGMAIKNQIISLDGKAVNFLYGMEVDAFIGGVMVRGVLRQGVDDEWTLNEVSLDIASVLSTETDKSKLTDPDVKLF